eukprot:scaffold21605_cov53-Phaeocystis_antarctica.AAC.1
MADSAAVDGCSGGEELRSYAATEVLAFLTLTLGLARTPTPTPSPPQTEVLAFGANPNPNPGPSPSPKPSPNANPNPNPNPAPNTNPNMNPNQVLAFVAARRVGCSLEPRAVAPFAALCIDPPAAPAAAANAPAAAENACLGAGARGGSAVGSAALHFVVTSRNAEVRYACALGLDS